MPDSADLNLLPVPGVRLGVARAGIKKPGRRDVVIMALDEGSEVAAVFTRNAFCAAPVIVARRHRASVKPRYLLINTGNANAGTGDQGIADAIDSCRALAQLAGCAPEAVLPFSTGVIGEPLPVEKISKALPEAWQHLEAAGWNDAAMGILTTDLVPKGISRQLTIEGQQVTVTGIAKGSGMIRPDMATMLAYVATDANIAPALLQHYLDNAVNRSFNRITVDGDTSTNDACLLIATGRSAAAAITDDTSPAGQAFAAVLNDVCEHLAKAIVRDGEGATKLITIQVEQGRDERECADVAFTIAHSPLVKTAFFASDPNWGRILAAVGRAGLPDLDVQNIEIYLGAVCIVRDGGRAADYREELGRAVMQNTDITIRVKLRRGTAATQVWTCDFSYDYVRINAEYRT